jgi:hypothetical protein
MKNESSLRRLARLLREAEEPKKVEEEEGQDSIDSQIDSFFSDYETESKRSKNEGTDFRRFVRRFLTEAEGDEKEEGKDKKDKDKKEDKEEPPKKLTIEDIDVDTFADSVVRLIDNYDSLLEVRNTILRRSVNFLSKNYSPDVAESYKVSLEEKHGLHVGKSKYDEDEDFMPPAADRAGASPGGS